MSTVYPYWDTSDPANNKYMVYPKTPFAVVSPLPNGFWRFRCYGNLVGTCPNKLGPFFASTQVQIAAQNHCQTYHYITPPPLPPAPVASSLSPNTAIAGSAATTITITGSNFVSGDQVIWLNSLPLATTFLSATGLTAIVPAAQLASSGNFSIYVLDPSGQTSASLPFTVSPGLTSLSPNAAAIGSAPTVLVNGSGYTATSVLYFAGAAKTTTFVNATQLSIALTATDTATAKTAQVYVQNAEGTTSLSLPFTIS